MTAFRPRILVIDDEQLIRRSISGRLSACGYQVLEAENGKTAIERATGAYEKTFCISS